MKYFDSRKGTHCIQLPQYTQHIKLQTGSQTSGTTQHAIMQSCFHFSCSNEYTTVMPGINQQK